MRKCNAGHSNLTYFRFSVSFMMRTIRQQMVTFWQSVGTKTRRNLLPINGTKDRAQSIFSRGSSGKTLKVIGAFCNARPIQFVRHNIMLIGDAIFLIRTCNFRQIQAMSSLA